MKKYRFEIILFIVEAICMILELVASRVLSPYFGNSNLVWTSVIGIILLSGSIGHYLGGIVADKPEADKKLKYILIISSFLVLVIPFIQDLIIKFISGLVSDIRIGAIITTIALFFLPSLFLGFLVPIVLKLKIKDLESCGEVSGKIYALTTLGGIFGTFLGGFFLIPNFGSIQILFVLAIILLLLVPLVDQRTDLKQVLVVSAIAIIIIIIIFIYISQNDKSGDKVLDGVVGEPVSYDTQYGRVLIYNQYRNDELIRVLNIDSGFESATYIKKSKQNDLVFEYTKYYDYMFKSDKIIKDSLLIGGAGYSYPKYYISRYPNKNMDVVEIDGEITNIAKKYFYLDELIKDYNLDETKRLNFITEDGRTYLNRNTKKYDAILNDAFSGSAPAKTLTTLEAVENIKKSLSENGLYLTNIISSLEGENSKFLRAEVNTLRQVFKNVYIVPCNSLVDFELIQNSMVICTDGEINIPSQQLYSLTISEDDIIITDNYCPIDTLVPKR